MIGMLVAVLLLVLVFVGAFLILYIVKKMLGPLGDLISKGVGSTIGAVGAGLSKVGLGGIGNVVKGAGAAAEAGDIQSALAASKDAAISYSKDGLLSKAAGAGAGAVSDGVSSVADSVADSDTVRSVSDSIDDVKHAVGNRVGMGSEAKRKKQAKRMEEEERYKTQREEKLMGRNGFEKDGDDWKTLNAMREDGVALFDRDEAGNLIDGGIFNADGSISDGGVSKMNEYHTKKDEAAKAIEEKAVSESTGISNSTTHYVGEKTKLDAKKVEDEGKLKTKKGKAIAELGKKVDLAKNTVKSSVELVKEISSGEGSDDLNKLIKKLNNDKSIEGSVNNHLAAAANGDWTSMGSSDVEDILAFVDSTSAEGLLLENILAVKRDKDDALDFIRSKGDALSDINDSHNDSIEAIATAYADKAESLSATLNEKVNDSKKSMAGIEKEHGIEIDKDRLNIIASEIRMGMIEKSPEMKNEIMAMDLDAVAHAQLLSEATTKARVDAVLAHSNLLNKVTGDKSDHPDDVSEEAYARKNIKDKGEYSDRAVAHVKRVVAQKELIASFKEKQRSQSKSAA